MIPDKAEIYKNKKTLVIDLDETLVSSSMEKFNNCDFSFEVTNLII